MDLNYISPHIRLAWDSTIVVSGSVSPRVIFDYELVYFKDGNGTIIIEDRVYTIKPMDIFLLKPGVVHAIYPDKTSYLHQPHIHFDIFYEENSTKVPIPFNLMDKMTDEEKTYFRENVFKEPPFDLPEKLSIQNLNRFDELMFDVIEEYDMKRAFYKINLKSKFLQLLVFILREHDHNTNAYSPLVQSELERIRDYIRGHAQISLTLDDLAHQFNLSKYYLTRIFKKRYGVSPIHYHQMVRMEKIREAILYTSMSLSDIAEMFGYESASVFSRAFHSSQGIAPSTLRKDSGRGGHDGRGDDGAYR